MNWTQKETIKSLTYTGTYEQTLKIMHVIKIYYYLKLDWAKQLIPSDNYINKIKKLNEWKLDNLNFYIFFIL